MSRRTRIGITVLPALLVALAGPASADAWMSGPSVPRAFAAQAPAAQPLEGEGANMRIVANVPLKGGQDQAAASDIELHGDFAYVGSYGEGLVIIDISDPRSPQRVGTFECPGGQNDIQLSPDATIGVMAIETTSNECHPGDEGFVVLDLRNKRNPRELAFVGEDQGLVDGSHNVTMDWPRLYVDQYTNTYDRFEIFDLSDPSAPKSIGTLRTNGGGGSHDLQVDHRPDGRVLAYSASIAFTDVLDVTDPTKPRFLQRVPSAAHGVGISHGAEPTHDRSQLIVTDEYGGGAGNGGCGTAPGQTPPSLAGQINTGSPGALHLLPLEADGTMRANGTAQNGAYNLPPSRTSNVDDGCTVHVFWQAPDENRLVTAWYGQGTRIIDFSDPSAPVELGFFKPKNANTWSAKPHRGFIFTGDIVRGMDVLEYTGENCARWPKTSGPAEVQRARYQGAAPPADVRTPAGCGVAPTSDATPALESVPTGAKASRRLGSRRFRRSVRVPGRRGKRTITVSFRRGKAMVGKLRFSRRAGRRARLTARVGGQRGRYRYVIRVGDTGRVLKRGGFRIRRQRGKRVLVPNGRSFVCVLVR